MNALDMDYYGRDTDPVEADAILANRWGAKERAAEPELCRRAWFDYQHMHPVNRTYLFAHLFTAETRLIIRQHIDDSPPKVSASGTVRDWEPIKAGDMFEPPGDARRLKYWKRKISSLIKARQMADHYAIPYPQFVKFGLRHWYFGRSYFLEQTVLPEPGLLNGEECRIAIAEKWLDELRGRIHHATHPRFQVAAGLSTDLDLIVHQEYILQQIARKSDPVPALRKFFALGWLSPERAALHHSPEQIAQAIA